MTLLFPAIIFVNHDLSPNVEAVLQRQLMITDTMDGYEFDDRVALDPNYPTEIHLNNLRILVIRSFYETTNRNLADVVIFVKAGLAYVEHCKFGPPGQTYQIDKLQLEELLTAEAKQEFFKHRHHVQSNILYPMFHHHHRFKYPFGTDCIEPIISKGLLVNDDEEANDEDHDGDDDF